MPAAKRVPATVAHEIRSELLPRLAALVVARVEASYSGYQGSGGIDMLDFLDQAGTPIDVERTEACLINHVREVLSAFLPDGFELSEGSQGDLYFEVSAGTFRLEHEQNYTATRSTAREWRI